MIKIGVITDVQYADEDTAGSRDYRGSEARLQQAVAELERKEVDFILHLGDAINGGYKNLLKIESMFRSIQVPFYNVLGNHDYLIEKDRRDELFHRLLVPEPGYYSFRHTDTSGNTVWRFILLNGNEISLYAALTEEEEAEAEKVRRQYPLPNGNLSEDWNGAMSAVQLNWLRQELDSARENHEKVIVCSHFPLLCQGADYTSVQKIPPHKRKTVYNYEQGWSLWNGAELLALIEEYTDIIRGYWAGHLHEGGYGERNGIEYITFKGIIEHPQNTWSVVTLLDTHGAEINYP